MPEGMDKGGGALPLLDVDLARALARVGEIMRDTPTDGEGLAAQRDQMRRASLWWNEDPAPLHEVRRLAIPAGARELDAILYRPSAREDLPLYVFLHGGGFRFGDASSNALQLRNIARDWGGCVLSLDYPHIPEAPFPHAVEAVGAAFRWLAGEGRARIGVDGARMAIGGASAGANVSCGAVVQIGGAPANAFLRAAALVVPVFDGSSDTASMAAFGDGPHFPTRASAQQAWRDYLVDPAHDADPRASIMRASPALFPPCFIAAAEMDIFRDGAARMAGRLADAGGDVDCRVYRGMTHLFFGYARMVPTARQCAADVAAFLASRLPAA